MSTTIGSGGRLETVNRQPLGGVGPWLRLFLRISGGAVAIAMSLGLLVVLTATAAQAQGLPTLDRLQAHQGSGMILMTSSGPIVAPLQSTEARLRVTGNTVRGVVVQRYRNPGAEWLEGSYLFPLPDDAAVDHLRMKIGERVVEGQVRQKEAARREFAQARSKGQRASLVEQQRPNAFTTRVTNIAPGAMIEIELQYQQTLALRDGAWRLRLPGVVAPRYNGPSTPRDERSAQNAQGIVPAGAQQFDPGSDMVQPVLAPGEPMLNPIRISVELDPGVAIVPPRSASHQVQVSSWPADGSGATRYGIQTIAHGEAQEVADRDFELEWSPSAAVLPTATLRHERHDGSDYGMLVINPPSLAFDAGERLHRETTFVVDTSGSMGGESIEQARSALAFGLQRLQPGDWFNIIQFNSTHASLFGAPQPVTPATLRQARRYVGSLHAEGGTEMRGAIRQALSAPLAAGLLGQVVFITDGAVDYEDELVSLVRDRIGGRRLFTVGIGSAPNGFFMRKAAEIGGGTFTFIGNTGEVERRMARLFEKIAHPASTDLAVSLDGGVLAEPIDMPRDLYAGEPLILIARFSELPRSITVSGSAGTDVNGDARRWRIPVDLNAAAGSGLHVLWARARIEILSDAIRQARHTATPQDELREKVVKLALDHHLVSDYTSLVAVDLAPVRPAGAPLQHGDMPANLPAGWEYERVFGHGAAALAQTATPAPLQLLIGVLLLAIGFLLLLTRRGSRFIASLERK